jgi:hypothetical protein
MIIHAYLKLLINYTQCFPATPTPVESPISISSDTRNLLAVTTWHLHLLVQLKTNLLGKIFCIGGPLLFGDVTWNTVFNGEDNSCYQTNVRTLS